MAISGGAVRQSRYMKKQPKPDSSKGGSAQGVGLGSFEVIGIYFSDALSGSTVRVRAATGWPLGLGAAVGSQVRGLGSTNLRLFLFAWAMPVAHLPFLRRNARMIPVLAIKTLSGATAGRCRGLSDLAYSAWGSGSLPRDTCPCGSSL